MKRIVALVTFLCCAPALAQQPDPAFLQRALAAVQVQRNNAMDAAAAANAQIDQLNQENAKLKAEVERLTKKPEEIKP